MRQRGAGNNGAMKRVAEGATCCGGEEEKGEGEEERQKP